MVVDVTHLLDREEGTAFDQSSIIFSSFDDGAVFHYDSWAVRDLDEMLERDGKARNLESVLTLPIRSTAWSIQRHQAKSRVTDFITEHFNSPANNGGMTSPMNTVIAQALQAAVHRKAYFEKVFTERDGKIVYDKLAWRPPATCTLWRDKKSGAFKGFKQQPVRYEDTDEITIKAERAWVYIHGTHRNPMNGASDLDVAYWCYQTKQKIRFLWYSFLEGQALPKTLVKARDEESAKRNARKVLALRSGGVAAFSEEVGIEAFESSGKGAEQFVTALRWLDSEASASVLANFTDLGAAASQGTGSFALSKDQTDFFLMSRQAVARELADSINQYVIPDLVHYNFGPTEQVPVFEFGPIAQDDASAAINLLATTHAATGSKIPREFFDELVERVAGFLDLDTTTVREGLERAAKEAEEAAARFSENPEAPPVAGVAGAVNEATRMVTARQQEVATGGPNNRPPV